MYISIVTKTFLFNILIVIVFSIIYSSLDPNNFEPTHPKDKLTHLDFLFYALTIQSSVGLPDVMAVSDLAKILVMIQQFILMGSAYILILFFLKNSRL
jgi:hypothetical protein